MLDLFRYFLRYYMYFPYIIFRPPSFFLCIYLFFVDFCERDDVLIAIMSCDLVGFYTYGKTIGAKIFLSNYNKASV